MARLLSATSSPCAPTNICLFDTPDSQIAFQRGSWLSYVPAFSNDSQGPFTFIVNDSTHFMQLNKTYISFRLKLERAPRKIEMGGNDVAVGPNVKPIAASNFIGCSLFNQVKVDFNNVTLFDSTHYAYKGYVQTLLGAKTDYKKSVLSAAGWHDDDEGISIDSAENNGFKTRVKALKSGELDICCPVLLEPFMTEKLLVPSVNMQLTFYRNTDGFVLDAGEQQDVKLTIFNMKLHMRAVEVTPSAALAIEKRLRTTPARYPYTSTKVKVLSVPAGRFELPFTVLYHDIIPRRIIIGLINPDAMEGDMTLNCFKFEPFDVSEIIIDAGGKIYGQNIQNNFEAKQYARSYVNMFEELGCVSEDRCPPISYKKYVNGHCFFAVNLSPMDTSNSWELVKGGTTQISIKFAKKVPTSSVNVVVFSSFDNQFCIDSFRNVFNENTL